MDLYFFFREFVHFTKTQQDKQKKIPEQETLKRPGLKNIWKIDFFWHVENFSCHVTKIYCIFFNKLFFYFKI